MGSLGPTSIPWSQSIYVMDAAAFVWQLTPESLLLTIDKSTFLGICSILIKLSFFGQNSCS